MIINNEEINSIKNNIYIIYLRLIILLFLKLCNDHVIFTNENDISYF